MAHLDETGVYVHVIADGGMSRAATWPRHRLRRRRRHAGLTPVVRVRRRHAAFHLGHGDLPPDLPEAPGRTSVRRQPARDPLRPRHENDGRMNLFRRAQTQWRRAATRRSRSFRRPRSWWPVAGRPEQVLPAVPGRRDGSLRPMSHESVTTGHHPCRRLRRAVRPSLIARRVREAHVYSEIVSPTISVAEVKARAPKASFSAAPKSVYESPARHRRRSGTSSGLSDLGLCYGRAAHGPGSWGHRVAHRPGRVRACRTEPDGQSRLSRTGPRRPACG